MVSGLKGVPIDVVAKQINLAITEFNAASPTMLQHVLVVDISSEFITKQKEIFVADSSFQMVPVNTDSFMVSPGYGSNVAFTGHTTTHAATHAVSHTTTHTATHTATHTVTHATTHPAINTTNHAASYATIHASTHTASQPASLATTHTATTDANRPTATIVSPYTTIPDVLNTTSHATPHISIQTTEQLYVDGDLWCYIAAKKQGELSDIEQTCKVKVSSAKMDDLCIVTISGDNVNTAASMIAQMQHVLTGAIAHDYFPVGDVQLAKSNLGALQIIHRDFLLSLQGDDVITMIGPAAQLHKVKAAVAQAVLPPDDLNPRLHVCVLPPGGTMPDQSVLPPGVKMSGQSVLPPGGTIPGQSALPPGGTVPGQSLLPPVGVKSDQFVVQSNLANPDQIEPLNLKREALFTPLAMPPGDVKSGQNVLPSSVANQGQVEPLNLKRGTISGPFPSSLPTAQTINPPNITPQSVLGHSTYSSPIEIKPAPQSVDTTLSPLYTSLYNKFISNKPFTSSSTGLQSLQSSFAVPPDRTDPAAASQTLLSDYIPLYSNASDSRGPESQSIVPSSLIPHPPTTVPTTATTTTTTDFAKTQITPFHLPDLGNDALDGETLFVSDSGYKQIPSAINANDYSRTVQTELPTPQSSNPGSVSGTGQTPELLTLLTLEKPEEKKQVRDLTPSQVLYI